MCKTNGVVYKQMLGNRLQSEATVEKQSTQELTLTQTMQHYNRKMKVNSIRIKPQAITVNFRKLHEIIS